MVMVPVAVAKALVESTTLAVKLAVTVAVGVPEIRPVEAFRVRPAGRLPALIEKV